MKTLIELKIEVNGKKDFIRKKITGESMRMALLKEIDFISDLERHFHSLKTTEREIKTIR